MRKIAVIITILWWGTTVALLNAQPVIAYKCEEKVAAYEEITGGTVVGAGLEGEALADVAFNGSAVGVQGLSVEEGFPIGFDFTYRDRIMNRFAIGSAGFVVLGKDRVSIDPSSSSFLFSRENEGTGYLFGVLSTATTMGCATTEISYKLIGKAPARTLVVQYKNLGQETAFYGDNPVDSVNLQIRLTEGTNAISFVLDRWVNHNSVKNIRIGIKGASVEDLHMRMTVNPDWTGTMASTKDEMIRWDNENKPADGLTFTFTPPGMCDRPAIQPTGLLLTATSTEVTGNFMPTDQADHYLVVMTTAETHSAVPEDGTVYKPGMTIGNGSVIAFTQLPEFVTGDTLAAADKYYFHVYATNYHCSGGPLYNVTSPLEAPVERLPGAPAEFKGEAVGCHAIRLSAESLNGIPILIAMTALPAFNEYGNQILDGEFGVPTGDPAIGETIEGGGTVIYKGGTDADIPIEGLDENTVYYFRAWSVGADNNYSTVWRTACVLTWGKVPFRENFMQMPTYEKPIGWEVTGDAFRVLSDNSVPESEKWFGGNVSNANMVDGILNTFITPWICLSDGVNRLLFNYTMASWTRMTNWQPYNNWDEREFIEIQATSDGENFETFYTISKENAVQLSGLNVFVTVPVVFTKFHGEKVKIKVNWRTYNSARLYIRNFVIEEKPDCDYPVNVNVIDTTITGESAMIGWTSKGEEMMWDLRYKSDGSDRWSDPVEAMVNPFLLTGLPSQTKIQVQVRAKCSLESVSPWSDPMAFKTGYAYPFVEGFSDNQLPEGWEFKQGELADTVSFCMGAFCRTAFSVEDQAVQGMYGSPYPSWLMLPVLDLGNGSAHYQLEFNASQGAGTELTRKNNAVLAVVVSADGGKNFIAAGKLTEWNAADSSLQTIGDNGRITVDLSAYTGRIRIGIYLYAPDGNGILSLDSIGVSYTCMPAGNVRVGHINLDEATLYWDGEADEWLVYGRKAGTTVREYRKTTGNEWPLTGLESKTIYEAGVTKVCSEGDTAKVMEVRFTTLSPEPCPAVTDVAITPDKTTAHAVWTGDAASYNFRFRREGTDQWMTRKTKEAGISLIGLSVETTYEYAVQSVCSAAPGDTSMWTETSVFTTLPLTCFAPSDFVVSKFTHVSATFTWENVADKYQIGFRKGEDAWDLLLVENATTATIDRLKPLTSYTARIRSICLAGDTSEWSSALSFRTTAIPECVAPFNLRVSGVTEQSALLEWDTDESNLTWDLRYREGLVTSWNTESGLVEKSYVLTSLKENTVYLWSVKACCEENRSSSWASQSTFTTSGQRISDVTEDSFILSVSKGIIGILNPQHLFIDRLVVYDATGRLIGHYEVQSNDHVIIPKSLNTDMIIIKITGKGFDTAYKIPVR